MGKGPASAYMKDVNEKKGGIYGLKKIPLARSGHDPMRGKSIKTSKMEGYHLQTYRTRKGLSIPFSGPESL
jgi:hypothetical protein